MSDSESNGELSDTGAAQRAEPSVPQVTRCTKCVLPSRISSLDFSDDGVCSVCRRQAAKASEVSAGNGGDDGQGASLEEVIEAARRRGHQRTYDCVLGLSGGRDSSYLAYLLRKKHGLRVLAAYYRTVFTPEVTDRNVRRLTSLLGIPLVELNNIDVSLRKRQAI